MGRRRTHQPFRIVFFRIPSGWRLKSIKLIFAKKKIYIYKPSSKIIIFAKIINYQLSHLSLLLPSPLGLLYFHVNGDDLRRDGFVLVDGFLRRTLDGFLLTGNILGAAGWIEQLKDQITFNFT